MRMESGKVPETLLPTAGDAQLQGATSVLCSLSPATPMVPSRTGPAALAQGRRDAGSDPHRHPQPHHSGPVSAGCLAFGFG